MKLNDLVGKKFGKLLVMERAPSRKRRTMWRCKCDCGQICEIDGAHLVSGHTKGCALGCGKIKDLSGQTFGKLTVLEFKYDERGWTCECECGTIKTIDSASLRSGTLSCGCRNPKLTQGEAGLNKLYKSYRGNARRRGYEFTISKAEFESLTSKKCEYCGAPPSNVSKSDSDNQMVVENSVYVFNGLDRVDNNVGYVLSNVVPCCTMCNVAKSTVNKDEFLSWIKQVYNHIFKEKQNV